MRKLKLQVQITVNGFVAKPGGELDWATWNWSDDIKTYVTELTNSVDTILLGRKMTDGFISHWTDYVKNKPDSEEYSFAKKMVEYSKVVFTKTLNQTGWENTVLVKGNIVEEVNKLKNQDGKGIIVYGGAEFVSSLIKEDLIDEYYLFVNPVAIKAGLTIFDKMPDMKRLDLIESKSFDCGINLLCYKVNAG